MINQATKDSKTQRVPWGQWDPWAPPLNGCILVYVEVMQPSVTTHTKLTISTHCYLYYGSAQLPELGKACADLGVCASVPGFGIISSVHLEFLGTAFHISCGAISESGYKYLEVKENGADLVTVLSSL